MRTLDPIAVAESAYALTLDTTSWLEGLAASVRPALDCDWGTQAVVYEARDEHLHIAAAGFSHAPPQTRDWLDAGLRRIAEEDAPSSWGLPGELRSFSEVVPASHQDYWERQNPPQGTRPVRDYKTVIAADVPDAPWTLMVGGLSTRRESTTPAQRAMFRRLSGHLRCAMRLRWDAMCGNPLHAEVVLTPDGRVLHAEGSGKRPDARALLCRGVLDRERARGPARRRDPEGALRLWDGLLDGHWSLVDRFDSDGHRHVIAVRSGASHRDPRALTTRQQQIVRQVQDGLSNKEIGFELGCDASTVATHVSSALRKLKLRRREELVAWGGFTPRTALFLDSPHDVAVLSVDPASHWDTATCLTPAERAVATRAAAGSSDREIARERQTSMRTVANQLRSVFRKLGVQSRSELIVRGTPDHDAQVASSEPDGVARWGPNLSSSGTRVRAQP